MEGDKVLESCIVKWVNITCFSIIPARSGLSSAGSTNLRRSGRLDRNPGPGYQLLRLVGRLGRAGAADHPDRRRRRRPAPGGRDRGGRRGRQGGAERRAPRRGGGGGGAGRQGRPR